MTRAILTLNAGSSSLKVALFDAYSDRLLAQGHADRIGPTGVWTLTDGSGAALPIHGQPTTHPQALADVIDAMHARWPTLGLLAVGHRVVHGGADRTQPVVVNDAILAELDRLSPFAPLHQPHNLAGIRAAQAAFPDVLQIACFDTAFHRTNDWVAETFALPRVFYDEGVRRYGFHGLSYSYIAAELTRLDPDLARGRVIVAHLGNGASMCGLLDGRSVASTMGFTALDGLPMGTRCGQIDPGVLLYLMDQKGMTSAQIADLLYNRSGLLGLSGLSHDMRTLEASETPAAAQAINHFVYRCQREIGGLAAVLGGIDALVFCGGIGEHSHQVRGRICERLGWMGIAVDPVRNATHAAVISSDQSPATVMVLATNEERVIADATRAVVGIAETS